MGNRAQLQITMLPSNENLSRNAVIARLKTALRARSGRAWSVTGGRGTAYGWITIDTLPSRRADDQAYREDQQWLARLLGLDGVHHQGVSIPASHDYYREYIDRAEGRAPSVIGHPYWD